MNDGAVKFEGTLEAKLLPKGEGALPNGEPRVYPDFYERPSGPNPIPKLSIWHRLKLRFHSWNLQRKIDKGVVPRGHVVPPEPYEGREHE